MKAKTVADVVEFRGKGLFTGSNSSVKILPYSEQRGIFFRKIGLKDHEPIKVGVDTLSNGFRCSSVSDSSVEIKTVEHVLSSLFSLGITSAIIEVEGDEIPALDGSAMDYVQGILDVGLKELDDDVEVFNLTETVYVSSGDSFIVATPHKEGKLIITLTIDYESKWIGRQIFHFELTDSNFIEQIARARTFCLKEEAEDILKKGKGKGGDTSNTIIVDGDNPLTELRYADEFVRHKILDLLGDLSALSYRLGAHIVAYKSGHSLNHQFIKKVEELREKKGSSSDSDAPILDIREVQKYLPHRYPMLLVDRVIKADGYKSVTGIKNVTYNEPYLQGHFPGNPVMPGVLILEAMAQLSGALLMRKAENYKKTPILLSIDKVRLRKTVVPGDQLVLTAETKKLRARTCEVHTKATVNGQLAAEADMKFMLIGDM